MSLQEVVVCDDVVCADYSDHLWLAVEEVVIGAGSRCWCVWSCGNRPRHRRLRELAMMPKEAESDTLSKKALETGTISNVCIAPPTRPETLHAYVNLATTVAWKMSCIWWRWGSRVVLMYAMRTMSSRTQLNLIDVRSDGELPREWGAKCFDSVDAFD